MARLWDRGDAIDETVFGYTVGDDYLLDDRLVTYDLRASRAHAVMLHASGLLDEKDFVSLDRALQQLDGSHSRGEWCVAPEEEDCHTAIENRLTALVGNPGRAIHLGRSRNDQVLAAIRLWVKEVLEELAGEAESVASALEGLGQRNGGMPMPGYSHLQRAMPSTVGLWLGAYAAEIRDDAEGLRAARRRADRNPLGSAAGFGVPLLALDRELTTQALGFAVTQEPVTAVQLSRGKAEASAMFEAALLAQDLGRLAADMCLFATAEFAFIRLPRRLTTGSSMLPQKSNPDVFEIVRGRSGEVLAALTEVFSVTAKMPSGYHRDLQLIKRPLFRGIDSVRATARVMAHVVPEIQFDEERMRAACDPSIFAAERAYRLVRDEGIPFREAYRRAAEREDSPGAS